jgi:hypothetical protein
MATVLEGCTTEKQRCVVRFLWEKDSMQNIFLKKYFLCTVGSVCRVKRFTSGDKCFADDEEVETELQMCLRQHSKYFYAAGFVALLKRWDKCNNVGGGNVEK